MPGVSFFIYYMVEPRLGVHDGPEAEHNLQLHHRDPEGGGQVAGAGQGLEKETQATQGQEVVQPLATGL